MSPRSTFAALLAAALLTAPASAQDAAATLRNARVKAALDAGAASARDQFMPTIALVDDDRNIRTVPGLSTPGLPRYSLTSLTVSRALGRNLDAFVGVQNLFDEEYFVGTMPTTVGSPRLVTAGVRVRFTGRQAP